jgi:hypothetical protein
MVFNLMLTLRCNQANIVVSSPVYKLSPCYRRIIIVGVFVTGDQLSPVSLLPAIS